MRRAMTEVEYAILLHPDPEPGAWGVTMPAPPGCVTQGASREEAPVLAEDAIRPHLAGLLAEGESVPGDAGPYAPRARARRRPGRARRAPGAAGRAGVPRGPRSREAPTARAATPPRTRGAVAVGGRVNSSAPRPLHARGEVWRSAAAVNSSAPCSLRAGGELCSPG